jgi:hypothetical protein
VRLLYLENILNKAIVCVKTFIHVMSIDTFNFLLMTSDPCSLSVFHYIFMIYELTYFTLFRQI